MDSAIAFALDCFCRSLIATLGRFLEVLLLGWIFLGFTLCRSFLLSAASVTALLIDFFSLRYP